MDGFVRDVAGDVGGQESDRDREVAGSVERERVGSAGAGEGFAADGERAEFPAGGVPHGYGLVEAGRVGRQVVFAFRLEPGDCEREVRGAGDEGEIVHERGRRARFGLREVEVDRPPVADRNGSARHQEEPSGERAAGDRDAAVCHGVEAVRHAAAGNEERAVRIDGGVHREAAAGDVEVAVGADGGLVRGGPGVDRGAVVQRQPGERVRRERHAHDIVDHAAVFPDEHRRAAFADIEPAALDDRNGVRHAARGNVHDAAGLDGGVAGEAAVVDIDIAAAVDGGFDGAGAPVDVEVAAVLDVDGAAEHAFGEVEGLVQVAGDVGCAGDGEGELVIAGQVQRVLPPLDRLRALVERDGAKHIGGVVIIHDRNDLVRIEHGRVLDELVGAVALVDGGGDGVEAGHGVGFRVEECLKVIDEVALFGVAHDDVEVDDPGVGLEAGAVVHVAGDLAAGVERGVPHFAAGSDGQDGAVVHGRLGDERAVPDRGGGAGGEDRAGHAGAAVDRGIAAGFHLDAFDAGAVEKEETAFVLHDDIVGNDRRPGPGRLEDVCAGHQVQLAAVDVERVCRAVLVDRRRAALAHGRGGDPAGDIQLAVFIDVHDVRGAAVQDGEAAAHGGIAGLAAFADDHRTPGRNDRPGRGAAALDVHAVVFFDRYIFQRGVVGKDHVNCAGFIFRHVEGTFRVEFMLWFH